MRDSAQALLRIIDDVLDFSKIEAGRLELEETAFSLSGLVAGAIDTLRPQANAKGLAIGGRDRARLRRCAGRRPDADPADPVQPVEQCGQIHRARRDRRARRHGTARRRADAGHARGQGHRHRPRRGAAGAPVRAVFAGRQLDDTALWRHRARPLDRPPAGAADGRRRRGRQRAGRRLDLHRDLGPRSGTGRVAARRHC